jgi:alpha-galactosidase
MAVWETGSDGNPVGIMDAVDQTEALGKFAGPGRWNDPDMLVIGLDGGTAVQQMHQKKTTGLSVIEERSQMSLYALLSAPLIIGADIRKIDSSAKEILLNKEVIAVNQDPLGIPGWRVLKLDELEVWKKPLEDGDYAIGLLNRGSESQNITATWRQLNLSGKYMARDLWKHKDLGTYSEKISRSIKPHQTILLRITPQK